MLYLYTIYPKVPYRQTPHMLRLFFMDKFNYLCIMGVLGEQVQTLNPVSSIDLGRMSPCSLSFRRQQTLKPIAVTALYADVFASKKQKEVL
jgi:hypothetical protein